MKRFKFSLEAVRVVRQRREREAMENYARALLEEAGALSELQGMDRELAFRQCDWQEQAASGCHAAEMVHRHQHCLDLEAQRRLSATRLKAASEAAEAAFEEMLRVRQDRAAADKFLEKQRAAHAREQGRQEQKFLDELAGRRRESAPGTPLDSTST
jgi:flagellar export protein FliJ